jgi:hypothetical protein
MEKVASRSLIFTLSMKAETIDEVIATLDQIIAESKIRQSPLGYFAALYRKVTVRVKEGIARGEFEDGARMEVLDVIFANRYIEAYQQHENGEPTTLSWQYAFAKTAHYWPVVSQHLLWGINAHINLDLGIAAAQTARGSSLPELKADFDKINELLAELLEEVQEELAQIWPIFKYLFRLVGRLDDRLIGFSMEKARNGAWQFAEELYGSRPNDWPVLIMERDKRIAALAEWLNPSGFVSQLILKLMRISEVGHTAKKIEILK